MPFQPETCAHCACTFLLTQHAFEAKMPPPEAVRQALLLGFAYGEQHINPPICDECRTQLDAHRSASHGPSQIQPPTPPVAAPAMPQTLPKPRVTAQPEATQGK